MSVTRPAMTPAPDKAQTAAGQATNRDVLLQCDSCHAVATATVKNHKLTATSIEATRGDTAAVATARGRWRQADAQAAKTGAPADRTRAYRALNVLRSLEADRSWRHTGCGGHLLAYDIALAFKVAQHGQAPR